MLVDSHCHLDYHLRDGDIDDVVARAHAGDVGTIVTICTKLSEADTVLDIASRYENVWCTIGVHPHDAGEEGQDDAERLIELSSLENVVGIGESGLDYYYEHSPRDDQRRSFRAHIAAARETGLPLVVHARDADEEMTEILCEESEKGKFRGVMHCFSSGPELAKAALDLGLYISFSGIVTFKRSHELRDIAAEVPLDKLLVETDAPYLSPEPHRGKRNEPLHVRHTASVVAELHNVDQETLAEATTENFFRLFNRARPPVAA
ncbi:MAG: LuxR family transcriptional regulator [Rhodospirillaceae bacterium]|nr:LuxR family transcriptional regulator [Rhodospirillaceae bacterium]HAA93017.1 LuxR family transcriptional regulator [Rhodospirillaceae bacterium]